MATQTPDQFQAMLHTVIETQVEEIVLTKQPILAEYGRELRNALNSMTPDVSKSLMAEYQLPTATMVASVEASIMTKELAIENAAAEVGLDQSWLAGGGATRKISEVVLGADDDWNVAP